MSLFRLPELFVRRVCVLVFLLACLSLAECAAPTPAMPKILFQTFRYEFGQANADLENVQAGQAVTIPIEAIPDRLVAESAVPITLRLRIYGPVTPETKESAQRAARGNPIVDESVQITNQTPKAPPLQFILPAKLAPGMYATVFEKSSPGSSVSGMGRILVKK